MRQFNAHDYIAFYLLGNVLYFITVFNDNNEQIDEDYLL